MIADRELEQLRKKLLADEIQSIDVIEKLQSTYGYERNDAERLVESWLDIEEPLRWANTPLLHNPTNYLAQIDHIWAVLSVDEGGEGVVAVPLGGMTVPLIAADEARLDSFVIPMAKQMTKAFNKPMRLVKFTTREVIEEFKP